MPVKTRSFLPLFSACLFYVPTLAVAEETPSSLPCLTNLPKESAQCGSANTTGVTSDSPYRSVDWYPYPAGTAGICAGRYVDPTEWEKAESGDQALDQPVIINAEEGFSDLGDAAVLKGSVDIMQGNRRLQSEMATFNQVTGDITLEGGATYREPGLLLKGQSAHANTQTLVTTLNGAQYVMHERQIRGDVETITRESDNKIRIIEGTYTQCPPGDESWKLSAGEIVLDQETGFGLAKHASLKVGNVPILYLPYFYFPIDDRRVSGFLYPSLRYSSDDGSEINTPYYFNIAPHMDDTLSPSYIEKRGILLENEFRYLTEHTHNTLTTAFLASDNDYDDQNRWLFSFVQPARWSENITSEINYIHVSDDDYMDDLSTMADYDGDSHLGRKALLTYNEELWSANALIQGYQTVDDDVERPYQRLPQLTFQGDTSEKGRLINYAGTAQLTHFYRNNNDLTGIEAVNGTRLHVEPEVYLNYSKPWFYVRPSLKLWASQYSLSETDGTIEENPSTFVPIASLDTGLILERPTHFGENEYRQTLEPRLFALYVPYESQRDIPDFDTKEYNFNYDALFRTNRFSGYDHIGDTQQLSLGLTTRLFDPMGRETLSASVGQAYYYADRKVTLDDDESDFDTSSSSDIATQVVWRANKRVDLSFDANFDHSAFKNTEHNLSVRYRADDSRLLNLSYRSADDKREQSTVSYLWPINERWSSLGVWQRNWLEQDDVDVAFGLEYESCCWKTRVVARHWLKDNDEKDSALYVQFVLKGLGSLGSDGGSNFMEKITGFKQRDENDDTF
jgi:LPS-assembly protein